MFFQTEVAEQLWNNDLAALQANAPVRSEEVVRHKDGTWHTYWTVKFPLLFILTMPLEFVPSPTTLPSASRQKAAQLQSEILFRSLFELSPDAVVILDPHDPNISSSIVDCNAAACLMNGYQRDELIGQSIDMVNANPYTPGGQTAYLEKLREAGYIKARGSSSP